MNRKSTDTPVKPIHIRYSLGWVLLILFFVQCKQAAKFNPFAHQDNKGRTIAKADEAESLWERFGLIKYQRQE